MNSLKPFAFSRSQRHGLIVLLAIIIALQFLYAVSDFSVAEKESANKQRWLAFQPEIDALKKRQSQQVAKVYPYNPNFITDFKGYKLGMSIAQIDRLVAFRKQNKYVNSAAEFQAVTKVSDSLLAVMSPYFKFPEWVTSKQSPFSGKTFEKKERIPVLDINQASKEDLIRIYGIGHGLSDRILKQKAVLGGFVNMRQMEDVWGLSPEVIENLNKYFVIKSIPDVKKIRINDASVKELSQFPYFRYVLAKEIVTYRSMHGAISNSDDLIKIKGFPVEKVNIIAVYLEF